MSPSFVYTTPPPIPYATSSTPMSEERRALLSQVWIAERRAARVFPPAVAAVLQGELQAFIELGARMGGEHRVAQLVREILAEPVR